MDVSKCPPHACTAYSPAGKWHDGHIPNWHDGHLPNWKMKQHVSSCHRSHKATY